MNSYDPRSSRKKPLQLFSDIRFPDPDPLLENWCPHLAKRGTKIPLLQLSKFIMQHYGYSVKYSGSVGISNYGFEMANQTIYRAIKIFFRMCVVFTP